MHNSKKGRVLFRAKLLNTQIIIFVFKVFTKYATSVDFVKTFETRESFTRPYKREKERKRDGGREGGREGGGREGGTDGRTDGGRERGREGGRERETERFRSVELRLTVLLYSRWNSSNVCIYVCVSFVTGLCCSLRVRDFMITNLYFRDRCLAIIRLKSTGVAFRDQCQAIAFHISFAQTCELS